ncbi:MAG: hypothetical protein LAT54_08665 [Cryomorphaceae bacterium]|nr:hypothetical protein [Cryomorphaceae bacterium]
MNNEAFAFSQNNIWLGLYDENLNLIGEGIISEHLYPINTGAFNDALYMNKDIDACISLKRLDFNVVNLKQSEVDEYLSKNIKHDRFESALSEKM